MLLDATGGERTEESERGEVMGDGGKRYAEAQYLTGIGGHEAASLVQFKYYALITALTVNFVHIHIIWFHLYLPLC